jgi:hypothetical protein
MNKIKYFFTWYVLTLNRTTFIKKDRIQLHILNYIIHWRFKGYKEFIIAKEYPGFCSGHFHGHKTIYKIIY